MNAPAATATRTPTRRRKATRVAFGSVRTLPSGRFQARYVGPDGQRHTAPMTFDAKRDAQGWLASQHAAVVEGRWTERHGAEIAAEAGGVTLAAYVEEWISTRTSPAGAPLRTTTAEEYRRLARTTLAPLAEVPVRALTTKRVRTWHKEIADRGTVTTAARAYGLLRAVYSTAVADGLVAADPVSIRGAQNGHTGKRVEPPTTEELAVIADAIATRYRAAVLVAAWGGLRFGEMPELRSKDLVPLKIGASQSTYLLRIRRAVSRTSAGFLVGPPKSAAGIRDVAIPPVVAAALDAHLAEYTEPGPDALVFAARSGGHLSESSLTKVFYPARDAAGRPDLPWHGLRHFAGTTATMAGLGLRDVQARLGHSTVNAAMRYQHAVAKPGGDRRRPRGGDGMTGRGRVLAYCQRGHTLARLAVLESDWWEADDWAAGPRWMVASAGSLMIETATPTTYIDSRVQAVSSGAMVPMFGTWDPVEDHAGETVALTCPRCHRDVALDVDVLLDLRQRPTARAAVLRFLKS